MLSRTYADGITCHKCGAATRIDEVAVAASERRIERIAALASPSLRLQDVTLIADEARTQLAVCQVHECVCRLLRS